MPLLREKERGQVRQLFEHLDQPVRIVNFTQPFECTYCRETREVLEEVVELSDKITLDVFEFEAGSEEAARYGVDKIPATLLLGEEDYGVRFYGIPSGYEFSTLLEDLIMVSRRDSGLSDGSREKLAQLSEPVHLEVFVTPTCPYCPGAVRVAHQMAMESEYVTADMVEATEFPQLSQQYGVRGVPKTVANGRSAAEGALPEPRFVDQVLAALQQRSS